VNAGLPFEEAWFDETPRFPAPPPERPLTPAERDLAVRCIDLTTLQGDDDAARVEALCRSGREAGVAALCVYPVFVDTCRSLLAGTPVRVATVAGGFPHGLSPLDTRVAETSACARLGADEIDVVIRRDHALDGRWRELWREVGLLKDAAGPARLKVILAAGELGDLSTIYRAALAALAAGAGFVKTSTGKEAVNATLEAGVAMAAAIRRYEELSGYRAGLKAAGGVRAPEQAGGWLDLVERDLGPEALTPERFRIGASGLLEALTG
jgi:deoxyribose-phosphate aldolase